ncbi:hypothetical protein BYT27DRAFT_7333955 [Phlegmacium glaucopus]|nr:hypothetical protein BYT27DRAFT_7333955 [Phlegmacium glaucopus]
MFAKNSFVALLVFAAPLLARADVNPTEPAPGTVFNDGTTCSTAWNGDTNSTTIWKNMAIELMTGDNFNMIHLTTVATNQDGTVSGRFTYPCPQVTPNSAIYFYQYSSPQTTTRTWTGRFIIATADGQSTPPTNATQPGSNEPIPWGTGSLVDPSQAVAAPSFASSGSTSSSSSAANSTTAAPTSSGTVSATASLLTVTTTSGTTSSSIPASAANSASPTAQTSSKTGGALRSMAGFDARVLGAVAAATLALPFVW